MINRDLIIKAWSHLRKTEFTIPNETLDFMRDTAIKALDNEPLQEEVERLENKVKRLQGMCNLEAKRNLKKAETITILREALERGRSIISDIEAEPWIEIGTHSQDKIREFKEALSKIKGAKNE